MAPGDTDRLSAPLPARLSQLLIAFTIEFDNEFERLMPHRTTRYGSTPGSSRPPWLVSLPMWALCMQHVDDNGVRAAELVRRSRLTSAAMKLIITRMSAWWGYLEVDAAPKPGDRLVRPSAAGRQARKVWAPLGATIEARWRERLGSTAVERLEQALRAVAEQLDVELPDYLPAGAARPAPRRDAAPLDPDRPMYALLSDVLFGYALDFAEVADLSLSQYTATPTAQLAVSANLLRVLATGDAVPVRDLPTATGVDADAIGNWVKALEKYAYATTGAGPADSRRRTITLTARGSRAAQAYGGWTRAIGPRWSERFGADVMHELHEATSALVGDAVAGVPAYAAGWRARTNARATLPHYPVVTHRGGFPDGA